MREHLESVAEQSIDARLRLEAPPLADQAAQVWQWYRELDAARGSSGFGPNPIGYADLEAWRRLTGALVRPHELGWLLEVDRRFLQACLEAPKKKG